jgi:hypothetical protein
MGGEALKSTSETDMANPSESARNNAQEHQIETKSRNLERRPEIPGSCLLTFRRCYLWPRGDLLNF